MVMLILPCRQWWFETATCSTYLDHPLSVVMWMVSLEPSLHWRLALQLQRKMSQILLYLNKIVTHYISPLEHNYITIVMATSSLAQMHNMPMDLDGTLFEGYKYNYIVTQS